MKVYISELNHEGFPFIWDMDPQTKVLTCTFELYSSSKHYDLQALLTTIEKIADIKKDDAGHYTLDKNLYPTIEIAARSLRRSDLQIFTNQDLPVFFKPELLLNAKVTSKKPSYFDFFISDEKSEIWGKTLCYRKYFTEACSRYEHLEQMKILSAETLALRTQIRGASNFYLKKTEQLKVLDAMFENVFPSLPEFNLNQMPGAVYNYYKEAIIEIIARPPQIQIPDDVNAKNLLIDYISEATMKHKLRAFYYFLDKNIIKSHPRYEFPDSDFLKNLKNSIHRMPQRKALLREQLTQLTQLILEAEVILKENNQTFSAFQKELEEKKPQIANDFSFNKLVYNFISIKAKKNDDKYLSSLTHTITVDLIEHLNKRFNHNPDYKRNSHTFIAEISHIYSDFYLCQEWHDNLKASLESSFSGSFKQSQKQISKAFIKHTMDFINQELDNLNSRLKETNDRIIEVEVQTLCP